MRTSPWMTEEARSELKKLAAMVFVLAAIFFLPIASAEVTAAVGQGLRLTQWYVREHVILCLLPAFLIAGSMAAFIDKASVLRYLGASSKPTTAYGVGAVSGAILAVCSCTILPLFAGIYRMGAGLGPAISFLYAGPAINVLAVIMTGRILGAELGLVRAIAAVVLSIIVGLLMATIFDRAAKDPSKVVPKMVLPEPEAARPLSHLVALFGLLILILVAANWSAPPESEGAWAAIHAAKWSVTAGAALALGLVLWRWFSVSGPGLAIVVLLTSASAFVVGQHPELPFMVGMAGLCVVLQLSHDAGREWVSQSWGYAKLITPLLVAGVFVAGLLLGSESDRGLVDPERIQELVGGNGLLANLGASVVGAFMYFATLTEIPILKGLLNAGMGEGPALALLLAGPALSLPSMLVIRSVLGTKRTAVYVLIVVVLSTLAGLLYGSSK